MQNLRIDKKGLSLIEVIIVAAIVLILFSVSQTAFNGFRKKQNLLEAANKIESFLKEARSMTISAVDSSNYGVHFEQNKAVFFKGSIFSLEDLNNKEFILNNFIEISDINLPENCDVVFNKLSGSTDCFGSIVVSLVSDSSKFKTVEIYPTGISFINE